MKNENTGEHFLFLDGLRGIAAFYVMLNHAVGIHYAKLSTLDKFLFAPLMLGDVGVCVFIVLSGWCLMLPVVKSTGLELRGGFRGFAFRRAKRILLPYYAALLIACLLPALIHRLASGTWPAQWFHSQGTYLGKYDLLAHLALVHDLWPQYVQSIAPPFWSVATEWQIYFCFALLLLPALRWFGAFAALVLSAVVGLAPIYLLPNSQDFVLACPWMFILFTMGMLGAVIAYSQDIRITSQVAKLPRSGGMLWLGLLFLPVIRPHSFQIGLWARWNFDVGVGFLTVWMLLAASRNRENPRRLLIRRILESQVAVFLGRFSYSLYLMHYTLILALLPFISRYHFSPRRLVCLNLLAGVPLALVGSYLFHLCFEKPLLRPRKASNTA